MPRLNLSSLNRLELVAAIVATRLTTLTNTTLGNWIAAGCPRNEDGSFNIVNVAAWLAEERRKKTLAESTPSGEEQDRHRIRVADAEWREMRNARAKDQLLPRAEVMEQFRTVGGRLRKRLEALEKRHGRQVGNDIRAMIDEVYRDLGFGASRTRTRKKKAKMA